MYRQPYPHSVGMKKNPKPFKLRFGTKIIHQVFYLMDNMILEKKITFSISALSDTVAISLMW